MKINGIEGMTLGELRSELQRGGKFVVFQYCSSVIILTSKRSSDVYFIRAGESSISRGLQYSLWTLLFGWWGIPWGPIYSIESLMVNFSGGRDVTQEVIALLSMPGAF
jgi:hypothetical protein